MIFAKFKNINIKGVNDINYLEICFSCYRLSSETANVQYHTEILKVQIILFMIATLTQIFNNSNTNSNSNLFLTYSEIIAFTSLISID